MLKCGLSRKRLIYCMVASVLLGCGILLYTSSEITVDARVARLMSLAAIRQSILLDPGGPCNFPNLSVNASSMMKFVKQVAPLQCSKGGSDWAICVGHTCRVKPELLARMRSVTCAYSDILWKSDSQTSLADPVTVDNSDEYHLRNSDFVMAECEGKQKITGISETWLGYLIGIRDSKSIKKRLSWDKLKGEAMRYNVLMFGFIFSSWLGYLIGIRDSKSIKKRLSWDKLKGEAMRYNVLMFGFDSLSRNAFIRKLPKSYKYLTEELNAQVMGGYNIVGDGTPQALIPILTGQTELELPDTRKRMGDKASYVDIYPFVWNHFAKNGYATAFHEDTPGFGIFTYRLKGFSRQPTDHYMRPYLVHTNPHDKKWSPYCNGDKPRHKLMLDYTRQFMDVYAKYPRFAFAFHGELSHDDYNLVQAADGDLETWMTDLKTSGTLDNTILIIMSDHGHRFAEIRDTMQGKQEERLPWFAVVLPKPRIPVAAHADKVDQLAANTQRLTTPFDIHATLLDVLGINPNKHYDIKSKFPPRSLSLFGPIPVNRTCGQASIEPHWCACLSWRPLSLLSDLPQRMSDNLVAAINKLTSPFRDRCAELTLDKVIWAMSLAATEGLLGFKKSYDTDGFLPDLSAKPVGVIKLYQVKVRLMPGGSLFEASLSHNVDNDSIVVKLSDISRINKYGDQAKCIYDDQPQLRKYCYCTRD